MLPDPPSFNFSFSVKSVVPVPDGLTGVGRANPSKITFSIPTIGNVFADTNTGGRLTYEGGNMYKLICLTDGEVSTNVVEMLTYDALPSER
jgi:hypothetical protein